MSKVLKAGALWLAIAVVVWLITIWRWQNTGYNASNTEIVMQLLVLPVALAAALGLALWSVSRLREKAASPIAPSAPAASAVSSPEAEGAARARDDAERRLSAWVMAEAVNLPVGTDVSSALSGMRAQINRPGLDAELQDFDGMPVFTARVPELDVDAWLDAQAHAGLHAADGSALSGAVLRGLALLDEPLQQMLSAVSGLLPQSAVDGHGDRDEGLPHASMGAQGASMKAHLSGVATPVPRAVAINREAMAPQLTVRLILPAHWPAAEREAAVSHVRRQCGSLLDWVDAAKARGVRWTTDAVARPELFWDELDQLIVQWSRDARPELLMVLAVDSALDAQQVERMQSLGELFTASHQTGKVPGEGAVGMLLANQHWPDLASLETPPVRLWRPVRTRRDKSADAAGRVGITALSAAIEHAVALSQANKEALLVVSDADHRASRSAELFEALQEVVPGLDPMLAVARVGESCGELGMARALVPSALACASLRADPASGQVALAAHVQSSHDRVVVAMAPWVPLAAAAA